MSKSVEVFLCYAHEDEPLRLELEKHLRVLRRQGLIDIWHDRNIGAGTEWESEIDTHLKSAQLILLLVSPDFMDSDYCYSVEMMRAMERHRRGEARVVPIILRSVYWKGAPFSSLQALPTDGKPINSSRWHNTDEAFLDVTEGLYKLIEALKAHIRKTEEEQVQKVEGNKDQKATTEQGEKMQLQHYRALHSFAESGTAILYKATNIQNRPVIVKTPLLETLSLQEKEEAIGHFKSEAHMLSILSHPQIPRFYNLFFENDHWYYVMDFIEGDTLGTYLERASNKCFPANEVIRIGLRLCQVLDYLHTRRPPIIYRDLKPESIMRTSDGRLYLIDFGIARYFKPGQTRDTIPLGTLGYAPAEQYGKAQTTPRSDIYSLGVTLHQLLTGSDPTGTPFQFAPITKHPIELSKLIHHMLAMDSDARPESIASVRSKLEQIAHDPNN